MNKWVKTPELLGEIPLVGSCHHLPLAMPWHHRRSLPKYFRNILSERYSKLLHLYVFTCILAIRIRKSCAYVGITLMTAMSAKRRDRDDQSHGVQAPDDIRWRALARLYERRSAVDDLIRSLERYQQGQGWLQAQPTPPSAEEM
jgi:hypothetical protein